VNLRRHNTTRVVEIERRQNKINLQLPASNISTCYVVTICQRNDPRKEKRQQNIHPETRREGLAVSELTALH
jgi:hypothetical protein